MMPQAASLTYDELCRAADAAGLACRGGFHPGPEDGVPPAPGGRTAETLVLLGFTGGAQWPQFAASAEYRDREPQPLDRWSQRVIGELARRFDATELYPTTGPPWWPFQRWAVRAEALHTSPLGILLHPQFGLWHAYRGALALAARIPVPARREWPHPCESCAEKPCIRSCPVGAIAVGRFPDHAACAAHVTSARGVPCASGGCLARGSCPLGAAHRYGREQSAFHMSAFVNGLMRDERD